MRDAAEIIDGAVSWISGRKPEKSGTSSAWFEGVLEAGGKIKTHSLGTMNPPRIIRAPQTGDDGQPQIF